MDLRTLYPVSFARLEEVVEHTWNEVLPAVDDEARYLPPHITAGQIEEAIKSAVNSTVARLANQWNTRPAANRLPLELLVTIFRQLPTRDRGRVILVSKAWKHVILTSPSIWTTIVFKQLTAPKDPDAAWKINSIKSLDRLLELSGACELRVFIKFDQPDPWSDVFVRLREQMHRICALRLVIHGDMNDECRQNISKFMSEPAPRLRTLYFDNWVTRLDSPDTPFVMFSDQAPLLRDVTVQCDIELLGASRGAFRFATNALISHLGIMDERSIAHMVQLFAAATDLTLRLSNWAGAHLQAVSGWVPLPTTVKVLCLYSDGDVGAASHVLECVQGWQHLSQIKMFRLSHSDEPEESCATVFRTLVDPSHSINGPTKTAAIDWYTQARAVRPERGPNVYMFDVDDPMHELVPYDVHPEPAREVYHERVFLELPAPLDPSLFAHVTRLYVGELVFDPETLQHAVPLMPSLVHLTVMIMSEGYHAHGLISPLIETNAPIHTLTCPNLRVLLFAANYREWSRTVRSRLSPDMIVYFVRKYLRYSNQLQLLHFAGVEVVGGDAEQMQAMLNIAEDTFVDPRFMAWIPNQRPESQAGWMPTDDD